MNLSPCRAGQQRAHEHGLHALIALKTKEKTMPFGVNLMKSPVLYQAAQGIALDNIANSTYCWLSSRACSMLSSGRKLKTCDAERKMHKGCRTAFKSKMHYTNDLQTFVSAGSQSMCES